MSVRADHLVRDIATWPNENISSTGTPRRMKKNASSGGEERACKKAGKMKLKRIEHVALLLLCVKYY
jgi:hypothetical protein